MGEQAWPVSRHWGVPFECLPSLLCDQGGAVTLSVLHWGGVPVAGPDCSAVLAWPWREDSVQSVGDGKIR